MTALTLSSVALFAYALAAQADAFAGEQHAQNTAGPVQLVGNTSTNTSTNTSSDSGARGSSYRHTHDWSVRTDNGYRSRTVRGTTRIERYQRRGGRGRDDD